MIFIIMNLNEQIYRIKNLMYEQPQVQVSINGDIDKDFGKYLELKSKDNSTIGGMFVTKMGNANNVDPDFNKLFDEKKFQTVPINYNNSLFAHSLEIDKNHQRNGYGSQILDHCHNFTKQNGYNYLTLMVYDDNIPAKNLYKKMGYKKLNSDENVEFYFVEL